MAKPGDEHRVVDGIGDGVTPTGEQRRGDGALVALQARMDPRIDGVTQVLQDRRVAQPPSAFLRRRHDLDRAHREAGGADALEEHVAGEIIGARPQRRERRHQPRLERR